MKLTRLQKLEMLKNAVPLMTWLEKNSVGMNETCIVITTSKISIEEGICGGDEQEQPDTVEDLISELLGKILMDIPKDFPHPNSRQVEWVKANADRIVGEGFPINRDKIIQDAEIIAGVLVSGPCKCSDPDCRSLQLHREIVAVGQPAG